MVRAVALLIAAITMSRPTIPKEEATRYAKVLNEIGSKYKFDPLVAVAIVHYESHWIPSAASEDGEDFGLGQVRARFVGACRNDEDPVNAPSDACKAVKAQLLTGEANLRQMGAIINANKAMCTAKRGKNKTEYWLAGYQGLSQPERNKYCIPGPTTSRVLDYHKELITTLTKKPPPKKGTAVAKADKKTTKTKSSPKTAGKKTASSKTTRKKTASSKKTAASKPAAKSQKKPQKSQAKKSKPQKARQR